MTLIKKKTHDLPKDSPVVTTDSVSKSTRSQDTASLFLFSYRQYMSSSVPAQRMPSLFSFSHYAQQPESDLTSKRSNSAVRISGHLRQSVSEV